MAAEQFPALQHEEDVSLAPEVIVELPQGEALLALGGGEEFEDLQLTDLVAQALAGIAGEEGGLLPSGVAVHGHGGGEQVGGLLHVRVPHAKEMSISTRSARSRIALATK